MWENRCAQSWKTEIENNYWGSGARRDGVQRTVVIGCGWSELADDEWNCRALFASFFLFLIDIGDGSDGYWVARCRF